MEARYDAVAGFYEEAFSDTADPVLGVLLGLAGPPAGRRVLDVACGHGRVTRELARAGAEVVGVDLSRALLDRAESLERAEPLGAVYVHADAATGPDLGRFDAVVCNFGLSDIDDLDGAARWIARSLRPGGTFCFSILHPCFPGAGESSGSWPVRYHDEGYWVAGGQVSSLRRRVGANHRTLSTYLNTLTRHGLTLAELSEPDPEPRALPYPLYLVARLRATG